MGQFIDFKMSHVSLRMLRVLSIWCLLPSGMILGQINMTKYVSDDLFEIKPVISLEDLETSAANNEPASLFEIEVNQGIEYWENGQLDEALDHFSDLASEYTSVPLIQYYLGSVHLEMGGYPEAIESFQKVILLDPLFMDARYSLGLCYLNLEEFKKAKHIMDELVQVPLYAAMGNHGLGLIASDQGNFSGAIKMFRKSIRSDSTFLNSYLPLSALEFYYFQNLKRCLKTLDAAVAQDSTWQEARITRGMISVMVDENSDQFLEDITILLAQDPYNYNYYSIKGFLDIELKNYRQGVENFYEAYKLHYTNPDSGAFKFNAKLNKDKRIKEGLDYYVENFVSIPSEAIDYIDKGICAYMNSDRRGSLKLLDSARLHSDHSAIWLFRAIIYQSVFGFNTKMAIEYYSNAIDKDTVNAVALKHRGKLYMSLDSLQQAYSDFNRLVELQPRDKMGYKLRGMVALQKRQFRESYKDFSMALGLDDNDSDLFFNRGMTSFYMGYFDVSIADFNQSVRLKPNDGEAYYYLYQNLMYKVDTLKAISFLDSASRYKRYDTNCHKELIALAEKFYLEKPCLAGYDRLVKYNYYNTSYRMDRGKKYLFYGYYDKAKTDFEKVLIRDKKSAEAHYQLGVALAALGESKVAQKEFDKAKKLGFEENSN